MNHYNNVNYIYSKINYSENRNMYMYSTHNWENFLEDYFKDRIDFLEEIKKKYIERNIENIDINKCSSNILLDYLLSHSSDHPKFLNVLLIFLRKLETKGKILVCYEDNIERELLPSDYIKLSYCVSKFLKTNYSIKYLNFFLKLNDKIIFMRDQWIGSDDESYFFFSISYEIEKIRELMEK
jgi:hypothetical protein